VINAGIDMAYIPVAVTVALAGPGAVLVDPTSSEEKTAQALAVGVGGRARTGGEIVDSIVGDLAGERLCGV
jgi:exosome complex RNA-binding protein Rrp42 (RNase PH superfamily)